MDEVTMDYDAFEKLDWKPLPNLQSTWSDLSLSASFIYLLFPPSLSLLDFKRDLIQSSVVLTEASPLFPAGFMFVEKVYVTSLVSTYPFKHTLSLRLYFFTFFRLFHLSPSQPTPSNRSQSQLHLSRHWLRRRNDHRRGPVNLISQQKQFHRLVKRVKCSSGTEKKISNPTSAGSESGHAALNRIPIGGFGKVKSGNGESKSERYGLGEREGEGEGEGER